MAAINSAPAPTILKPSRGMGDRIKNASPKSVTHWAAKRTKGAAHLVSKRTTSGMDKVSQGTSNSLVGLKSLCFKPMKGAEKKYAQPMEKAASETMAQIQSVKEAPIETPSVTKSENHAPAKSTPPVDQPMEKMTTSVSDTPGNNVASNQTNTPTSYAPISLDVNSMKVDSPVEIGTPSNVGELTQLGPETALLGDDIEASPRLSVTNEPSLESLNVTEVSTFDILQSAVGDRTLPFTVDELQENIKKVLNKAVEDGSMHPITSEALQKPELLKSIAESMVEVMDKGVELGDKLSDLSENGIVGTLQDKATELIADNRDKILEKLGPILDKYSPEFSPSEWDTISKDMHTTVEVVKSASQPAVDILKNTMDAKMEAMRTAAERGENIDDAKSSLENIKSTIDTLKDVVGAFSLFKGVYMVAKSVGQVTTIRKNLAKKHPGVKLKDVFTLNRFQKDPSKRMTLGQKLDVMSTLVQPLRTLAEGATDIVIGVSILSGAVIGAAAAFTILPFAGIASAISSGLDANKSITERAQFSEIENEINRITDFQSIPGNEGKDPPPISNTKTLIRMARTLRSASITTDEASRLLKEIGKPGDSKADKIVKAKKFISLKKSICARRAAADVVRSGTKFTASFAFVAIAATLNPIGAIAAAVAIGGTGAIAAHKIDSEASSIEKEMFKEFPEEEPPELPSKPVNILSWALPKKEEEPEADSVS
ncbi:hypothetical protein HOG98_07020 [bacterium]|jgi:hypothetical protein|nr:hypothetical protein [bacterium]